jgi:adenylate cyclase
MRTRLARVFRFNSTVLGLLLTAVVVLLFVIDDSIEQGEKPFFVAPFHRLELLAYDARFRFREPRLAGPEVVIAAIDERSMDDPDFGRWPWPRTTQAELVNRLVAYGAAVIGYDAVFSEPDITGGIKPLQKLKATLMDEGYANDPTIQRLLADFLAESDHDKQFAAALRHSDRVILGYFFHWDERDVQHLSPETKQIFLENIHGSEHLDIVPSTVNHTVDLDKLPLKTAVAVESSLVLLSKAVCKPEGAECRSGFFSSDPDEDGVIRRYPLIVRAPELQRHNANGKGRQSRQYRHPVYPPLALRILERYLEGPPVRIKAEPESISSALLLDKEHKKYEILTDRKGRIFINYLGPSELQRSEGEQKALSPGRRFRFPRYSVVDIVKGNTSAAPPGAFRNKIVLVGATATAVADQRVTPVDPNFPGVETHATVIDNILHRNLLARPHWEWAYAMGSIFLVGLLLARFLPRLGPLWGDLLAAVLFTGSFVLNYRLFADFGWSLNIVYPPLATVLVWAGMTIYHYAVEQKGSRFIKRIFSLYLSKPLVEQMVLTKIEPKLGGSSDIRTAYFTDIASFSSFSEVLEPTELVELLNEYLTEMTDILLAEGGTLDKYEGDAILAFFGAPIPQEDHAARALRVALGMQQALARLRKKWTDEGDKWPELVKQMRMRIGINSGKIVVGNMGSTMRMDYTMTGDVVNTAARLESSAKQYGVYIQCTSDTLNMARAENFECEWRVLDKVRVVGKTEPIETVEIVAYKGQLPEELVLMRELYYQGLELYRQQRWDEAKAKFAQSEELEERFPKRPTTPSRVYLERCDFFKANPPGKDWDGTWTLTSK